MGAPDWYESGDGEWTQVTRWTQMEMRYLAMSIGEVDGIPLAWGHMSIHRTGMFSLKEDNESSCRTNANSDHMLCTVNPHRSSDSTRATMMWSFKEQTHSRLTEESFEPYDEARLWPHP